MAPSGSQFQIRDCHITKPRAIVASPLLAMAARGHDDRPLPVHLGRAQLRSQDRQSIGFNANANDLKIRDNWAMRFRHFGILGGSET